MNPKVRSILKKVFGIALVIALLLLIPPIANAVATTVGHLTGAAKATVDSWKEKITDSAKGGVLVAVGIAVCYAAAAFAAAPIVAVGLLIVGLAVIGWGIYNIIKPSGQKPDNTKIDIYN